MGKEYDITKPGDMRRFQRDLEKTAKDIVATTAHNAQQAARVRCPVHGQQTQVHQTDSVGSFDITGCCDAVVQQAQAAAARYFK
jgi:hypothetical protein